MKAENKLAPTTELENHHSHNHTHLKDEPNCCGDCKGGGQCSRIKLDFSTISIQDTIR